MTSAYEMYGTDSAAEREGVTLNFGDYRVLIARAGGANERFQKLLRARLKPYKFQIDNDTMDEKISEDIVREAYSETVILGWDTRTQDEQRDQAGQITQEAKWEPYFEGPPPAREQIPFTPKNCAKVLKDLPDLFRSIQKMATQHALFRKEDTDDDAKNS